MSNLLDFLNLGFRALTLIAFKCWHFLILVVIIIIILVFGLLASHSSAAKLAEVNSTEVLYVMLK